MSCPDITEYKVTDHALFEMQRRDITSAVLETVLKAPAQRDQVRPGRCVYQSRVRMGTPQKEYVLRVFVDVDRPVPEVVTVYRTTKIEKYWR